MFLAVLLALQAVPTTEAVTCPDGTQVRGNATCAGLIFFDSGESEIRREWRFVLNSAAASARAGGRLVVTEHSDSRASTAFNLRKARERAETVGAALVERGVRH